MTFIEEIKLSIALDLGQIAQGFDTGLLLSASSSTVVIDSK